MAALPLTVRSIAVLDRTKEPGSLGEPLYQDVVTALSEDFASATPRFLQNPRVIGGRYGISSKEFTPAMVKGIFDELKKPQPKNHFTIGIADDVTHTSLDYDPAFSTEDPRTIRALFYGLGSDGTVGANKNSIKIIGRGTDNYVQGYFVYDSKKSGSVTMSHLRFGPEPIRSTLPRSPKPTSSPATTSRSSSAWTFSPRPLRARSSCSTRLMAPDEVWQHLPRETQEAILAKKLAVLCDRRLQASRTMPAWATASTPSCRPASSPSAACCRATRPSSQIKQAIKKTYGKRGDVVQQNFAAVDAALAHLHRVDAARARQRDLRPASDVPARGARASSATCSARWPPAAAICCRSAPAARRNLPHRHRALGEAQHRARDSGVGRRPLHPVRQVRAGLPARRHPRQGLTTRTLLASAPATFKTAKPKWRGMEDERYTLQVAPEDCTGCASVRGDLPGGEQDRAASTRPSTCGPGRRCARPKRRTGTSSWRCRRSTAIACRMTRSRTSQLLEPLFEFSGACAGCGETPYIKLLTQLFGDRLLIANATGCSSIYGGNLPTTPYSRERRRPRSGLVQLALRGQRRVRPRHAPRARQAERNTREVCCASSAATHGRRAGARPSSTPTRSTEAGIAAQRERVALLKAKLAGADSPEAPRAARRRRLLVRKSVWIVGGDGWAYDIGYGGLDHVLASGRNVNVLVLDTEVYSNTGGQMSKSTPRGAVAKFAAGGKPTGKKDLAMMAMSYGTFTSRSVAMGGSDAQTLKAFQEAEAYDGPSLIIAYSHCIAHGYDLVHGMEQQKAAVHSGYWPLIRYNPALREQGKNPFQLDSRPPVDSAEGIHLQRDALHHARPQPSGRCRQAAGRSPGRRRSRVARSTRNAPPEPPVWTRTLCSQGNQKRHPSQALLPVPNDNRTKYRGYRKLWELSAARVTKQQRNPCRTRGFARCFS